jgi:hypothetical protein
MEIKEAQKGGAIMAYFLLYFRAGQRAICHCWKSIRGKGKRMTEEGTLGIVRVENTYQVRYASNNPHRMDRQHYKCSDEAQLGAFLQQLDLDSWYIKQVFAELWKGRLAALPIVLSAEQIQEYFAA